MVVSDESPLVDERERERGVDVDVMAGDDEERVS